MDTVYTIVGVAVGGLTLLTAAWRLGYWQAKQEARITAQDEEIKDLREELEEGRDDDDTT